MTVASISVHMFLSDWEMLLTGKNGGGIPSKQATVGTAPQTAIVEFGPGFFLTWLFFCLVSSEGIKRSLSFLSQSLLEVKPKWQPLNSFPSIGSIPHEVPQILINREPLPHLHFDVELLGDCDVIINELCQRLGSEYTKLCYNSVKLSEITEKPPRPHKELEALSAELPPTPLNISEGSSSPGRMSPPDPAVGSQHPPECKLDNCEPASETKGTCPEETPQDTQVSSENPENPASELMNSETMKENGSNDGENKEKSEILKKCWVNRSAKEQISKRLDGKC